MKKVSWGVIGVAKIATGKVIPAMHRSEHCSVDAIASRSPRRAREAAEGLGIPRSYGSYEELLADPEIEAVYNPLPNHLHVPWSIRAAEAGKHVLCEKPIALTSEEAQSLIEARDRNGVLITEAFMVRTHPQWLRVRELIEEGRIGRLRVIHSFFSYFLTDPNNVRNQADIGGGGLMDIGCYPITTSRFVFAEEPQRVLGLVERDPRMRIDRLSSAILDFPSGQATFTCSTQLVPYQRAQFFGTSGRIEICIPYNAPPDRPCQIRVDDGSEVGDRSAETIEIPVCDQYAIQGDRFSRAIREGTPPATPLEDAVQNMRVIEAVLRSAASGSWETP